MANAAYCPSGSPYVECTPVDGVQLPTLVGATNQGLAGALPPSLKDLGPSLTMLDLYTTGIASVPTEIATARSTTSARTASAAQNSAPAPAAPPELAADMSAIRRHVGPTCRRSIPARAPLARLPVRHEDHQPAGDGGRGGEAPGRGRRGARRVRRSCNRDKDTEPAPPVPLHEPAAIHGTWILKTVKLRISF